MVYIEGINAHIVVLNTALREFPPTPSEQRHTEPNTTLTYVEMVSNSPYSLFVEIPAKAQPRLGDAFLFRIFVDGVLNTTRFVRNSDEGEEKRPLMAYLDAREGDNPLVFPYVVEDLNESEVVGDAQAWEEREVVLQISQVRLGEAPADATGWGDPDPSTEPVGDADSVFAITFKYRPRLILQSMLDISKRDPSRVYPWDESPSAVKDPDAHPADEEWKKALRLHQSGDLYCICRKVRPSEPVVCCDNDDCEIKSFHWGCVGLREEPWLLWFCPFCREMDGDQLVVAGGTTEFLGPWKDPKCRCGINL